MTDPRDDETRMVDRDDTRLVDRDETRSVDRDDTRLVDRDETRPRTSPPAARLGAEDAPPAGRLGAEGAEWRPPASPYPPRSVPLVPARPVPTTPRPSARLFREGTPAELRRSDARRERGRAARALALGASVLVALLALAAAGAWLLVTR